ncbi:zinc finger protein 600 isoform X2 [Aedes albopictus]|uniref:C2h2-type zn-finger protein n=1 Tax=Aedes albopictus TaxID=7160 RepID=A0ABM1XX95_AEDAL|nr:zinc finger protein 600-like isoform X2 [Aedes albopictus]
MDSQAIKTEPEEFRKNPYPVCRLCLSEGELADVFDEEGLDQLMLDLLSVYLDDPISQSVCIVCHTRLIEFHQFRIRCQEVQTVLQSWLQSTIQQETINLEQAKRNQSSEISNAETNPLQCEVCQKLFKTRKVLVCHKKIHQPRKHICKMCSKPFGRRQQLLRHMKLVHSKEPETTDDTILEPRGEIVAVIESSEQKQDTQNDALAPKTSVKLDSDATHQEGVIQQCNEDAEARNSESLLDTNGGVTSEIDYEATSSSHVADGKEINIVRNELQCDICSKTFKLGKTMRWHRKKTHGMKEFICPICERPFALQNSLQRHILTHQSVEERKRPIPAVKNMARPFKCDTCEKTFISKGRLWGHQRKAHGPKNHECHICSFRFTMRKKLEEHIKRHSRDRDSKEDYRSLHQMQPTEAFSTVNAHLEGEPKSIKIENEDEPNTASYRTPETSILKCEKCQKTYTSQQSLWLHYKFAHKPKKLKCSICSGVFVLKKRLEKHILTNHKQEDGTLQSLNCSVCSKVFSTKGQLNRHVLIHGLRKHCCSVCNKTFTKPQSLESHMRRHTDSKDDSISQDIQKRSQPSESQLAENSSECQTSLEEGISLFEAEEFKIEPE